MNLRKHVAGFMLFSLIVGTAIFINALLTFPVAAVPPVPITITPVRIMHTPAADVAHPASFKVVQISLDLRNRRSYTELRLERLPGQPAPESIWVTTIFFAPERQGIAWVSKAEVRRPFAQSDWSDVVAAASDSLFPVPQIPRGSYFARVYLSTQYSDNSYLPDEYFGPDTTDAVPVVVHWPDENSSSFKPTLRPIN